MKRSLLAAGAAFHLTITTVGLAASPVEPMNKNRDAVALKGYDPVAYFTLSKPVKGLAQYSHDRMGARWWFMNSENRDMFAADPQRYAPQFGGYCSWAVSQNYTADIDPDAWKIVDGKLYLNYNQSIQKKWEQDLTKRIEDANRNWPGLHK
jgi:hypothetical protein